MVEFASLKPKTNNYLTQDNNEDKKAKSTKTFFINIKFKFEDYEHNLKAIQFESEINQKIKKKTIRKEKLM